MYIILYIYEIKIINNFLVIYIHTFIYIYIYITSINI